MHQQPTSPATEVKRLQRCMNDLVSVLALPAVWSLSEPHRILETFLDALMEILDLDFLYARVRLDSPEAMVDALRTSPLYETGHRREEITHALNQWSGEDPQQWSEEAFRPPGGQRASVFPIRMGIEAELGLIAAGSRRAGFPEQTEILVLSVAANQLAIGLQHAILLNEQKRVARELDRRVAERTRELAETNRELQLQVGLLQHLPVSAWTLKPDGTPDFMNQVWLEYSGQTLDFVRSHPEAWMTAVHPEDRERASRAFWEGVRSGQGFAMETRSRRGHDGIYRWQLNRAEVLRDAEGKVLKFVGTSSDIDDQKRAEQELRASENNFRQIVNSIPGLVCTLDAAGEIQQLNRPLLEYFGKTPEELKGWKMTDAVHPEDLPEVVRAYTYSVTTGTPYAIEHRCRRADGVYRWFQVRALAVHDGDNNISGWYVLLTDIEDRKRAEEALRASEQGLSLIINTMPVLAWSALPDGVVEFFNQRWLDYTGLSPEQAHGWGWTEAVHRDDLGRMTKHWQSMISAGGSGEIEARFRRFDGDYRWFLFRADPMRDESGAIIKWYGTNTDIDDWKQAQEELRNTQAELARMMRVMTIGQLTASIAHEVSQPLSGIITNASTCLRMLKSYPPNIDGALETAQRTIRDGNRASDVITRLRTLFSKKQIEVEPLDLNEAAREVIALLSGELQRNDVILKQEFRDHLPTVNGDRVQLQQVILNLLRNASDAMSSVADRPRQMVLRTELEDEHVCLSIQDSGVGFAPEVADQMFESFYTTKSDGMGVGLSVSRSIIEANHGRLWATANDGPGATFAFSIPCEHGSAPLGER
jgi:PAS domain S-box-containing protein